MWISCGLKFDKETFSLGGNLLNSAFMDLYSETRQKKSYEKSESVYLYDVHMYYFGMINISINIKDVDVPFHA